MLSLTRTATALLVTGLALAATTAPAAAQSPANPYLPGVTPPPATGSNNGGSVSAGASNVVVTEDRPAGAPSGPAGGGGPVVPVINPCGYDFWMSGPEMVVYLANFVTPLIAPPPADQVAAHGTETTGGWYRPSCTYTEGSITAFEDRERQHLSTGPVWSGTGPPPPPPISVDVLVQIASNTQRIPDPRISLNPTDTTVTRLETWVWADSSSFEAFGVTATSGPNSATVRVTPASMSVSAPNADAVGPCQLRPAYTGPGSGTTDCSVTFRRSSASLPGATATITVEQLWTVSWTGSDGSGGQLGDVRRTATVPVRVAEVQSVIQG